MKNIGVYLNSEPFGGGTYQYNLSIIEALSFLNQKEYSVDTFSHSKKWKKILPKHFNNYVVTKPIILRLFWKFFRLIFNNPEFQIRFASIFNPVIKKINESKCDLVIYPSQDIISYQTNKKSLSTIHDLMHRYEPHFAEYQDGTYNFREIHYKMICKYASGILVDSELGKEQVIQSYNITKSKLFVLPFTPPRYILGTPSSDVISKYQLPKNYLFYPAQFWEHKNHLNLIKALKIILNKNLDINLVLVGAKKNNYIKTKRLIKKLNLENHVCILGYVENKEMVSLYKNAICTIFVSLIGPTNIPPLEAFAAGSPLICSNVYAMPEQVGDAALLVNPKDPQDIAEKIEKIMSDKILQHQLKKRGFERIKKFDQEKFNVKFEQIINKLI